jgi:hypothetical protein
MNATDTLRLSILAILSVSAATAHAADPQPPTAADTQPANGSDTTLDTIIVTGVTSQRTLLNSSVDVTPINPTEIEQKAPAQHGGCAAADSRCVCRKHRRPGVE